MIDFTIEYDSLIDCWSQLSTHFTNEVVIQIFWKNIFMLILIHIPIHATSLNTLILSCSEMWFEVISFPLCT